jgi:formylglycine-generating enzyme required for sulfatase activity
VKHRPAPTGQSLEVRSPVCVQFAGATSSVMENLPVVFVSRYADVAAYTKWRTAKEGRAYRLPTMYGM